MEFPHGFLDLILGGIVGGLIAVVVIRAVNSHYK
jgi:hypothetical protein